MVKRFSDWRCAMKTDSERLDHVLLFQSLIDAQLSYAFPCDSRGHVDMDALSESVREDYLYARAVVGREYLAPAVIEPATD
jgi:hypothetical protein